MNLGITGAMLGASLLFAALSSPAAEVFVSPTGSDTNPGTAAKPLKTLQKAQTAARKLIKPGKAVTVTLGSGTFYLSEPLILTPLDTGTTWRAHPGESVTLSGGRAIKTSWKPFRDGIMMCEVPWAKESRFEFDQLFLNGEPQHMARYPNYDSEARNYGGVAADCISPERVKRWKNPVGGYVHALHVAEWGDFHYRITGVDDKSEVKLEGGWQNNRRMGMHRDIRFVENIFEELDAPGEWYLDRTKGILYYMQAAGVELAKANVEAAGIRHLIELRGSKESPVRNVHITGLRLTGTARTFMDNKEPLLRSDWTTYRGGAVFATGTENCALEDCFLDQVGGNAIFVNNYNRGFTIRGCQIARSGGNAVAFVGDPGSVRSPLFEYGERQSYRSVDKTTGPKTDNYPADCLVEECLIYTPGSIEKQTTGVEISMAEGITIRHCSIYDCPRAGINISEGTFGGHVIEYCDIFDTVKETGDHGSFNSWGRDRWWGLTDIDPNKITAEKIDALPKLDMVKPVIIRNNRWRCDHGWDIDLDDGSTWYQIYNNLCLHGGIKNREGFFRTVENNIMVDNSFHPHVWFVGSGDIFRRNIVFTQYAPIGVPKPWGQDIDYNLLHDPKKASPELAAVLREQSGRDEHSITVDAMFVDPKRGDYRVKDDSPALALGFKNFPMDRFGVTKPSLRKIARTPRLPGGGTAPQAAATRPDDSRSWMGANIKNVVGLGEVSAYGLPTEAGVVLTDVPAASAAFKAGLRKADVILEVNGTKAEDVAAFLDLLAKDKDGTSTLGVWRAQQRLTIALKH